jgi:hypothetical protein
MDASKLTISPDTLRFQKMSRTRKAKLRRQNVIDLIRSKPYGTPITLAEFAQVAQVTDNGAFGILRYMVRKGMLNKDVINRRHVAYTINGPITVRRPATKTEPAAMPPAETTNYAKAVAEYAKEFYWTSRSDSLHEFLDWLDKRELELRRKG